MFHKRRNIFFFQWEATFSIDSEARESDMLADKKNVNMQMVFFTKDR
jgi:hypothetical protein